MAPRAPVTPVPVMLLLVAVALVGLGHRTADADVYPRQPGIDVEHSVFRLTLSDETDAIEGEATVQVRILEEGVRTLALDLVQPSDAAPDRGMTVSEVTEVGSPLAFEHTGDRLRIALEPPGRRGLPLRLVRRWGQRRRDVFHRHRGHQRRLQGRGPHRRTFRATSRSSFSSRAR
jgi:hypothetical protein